jgi:hypothetical protein
MYMKKTILPIITLTLLMQSCIKDIGTHPGDYANINDVTVSGLQQYTSSEPFNVLNIDQGITIEPGIVFTQGRTNLKFEWLRYDSLTVFATGERLRNHLLPDGWNGNIRIIFRITDTVTGVKYNTDFYINVVDPVRNGFWVLQRNAEGYTRLDMLSWVSGTGNGYNRINGVNQGIPLRDVLSDTSRWQRESPTPFPKEYGRGPRRVVTFLDPVMSIRLGGRAMYLLTDHENTYRIDPRNFQWSEENNVTNTFLTQSFIPDGFRVNNIVGESANNIAIMNAGGNIFSYTDGDVVKYFSVKNNTLNGTTFFPASPQMSINGRNYLIFDTASKSFYSLNTTNSDRCQIIDTAPGIKEKFVSYRNMGQLTTPNVPIRRLVFSGTCMAIVGTGGEGARYSFNILEDINGDFWLLRVWMTSFADSRNFEQETWQKTDLKQRGFTADSPIAIGGEWAQRQFYYAVGGTIYQYNIPGRTSTAMNVSALSGEVTYLGFTSSGRHGEDLRDQQRFIVVGSYNGVTGTKTHYTIPQGTGTWTPYQDRITGQLHMWTGFDRIVNVINR